MPRTILFDFDGTIANTIDTGVAVFNDLARRYGFLEITPQNAEQLRGLGPRGVMKELSIPMIRVPLVVRSLRKGVRTALPTLRVMDGVRDAVLDLRSRGYRLGIVTSNSEENVQAFLAKNEMDCFDFVLAGVGVFSKASAIKKVLAHEGLQHSETVFVGDEIRDVEAAIKNKVKVIGVTWGVNSREGLSRVQPDFIVDTPKELIALLSTANVENHFSASKLTIPIATQ